MAMESASLMMLLRQLVSLGAPKATSNRNGHNLVNLWGGPSNVLDLETERYIPYTIHAPFQ